VSFTVTIPDELGARLREAASRRGKTVDQIAAEALDERFPSDDSLEAFIGSGASGDHEPLDLAELRREAADAKSAEGV
jgi:hypothetical protein